VSKVAAVRLQDSATKLHVELGHFHGMGIAPRGAANRVHFQQVVIEMLGFAFEVVVRPSFARSAGDGMDRVVVVAREPPSAYGEDTGPTQRQGSIARHYEPGSNRVRLST
jgi:hypothetical protein